MLEKPTLILISEWNLSRYLEFKKARAKNASHKNKILESAIES